LIVAGTSDGIVMVEAGAKEVGEEEIVQALDTAHKAIRDIVAGIEGLAKQAGKAKKTVSAKAIDAAFEQDVRTKAYDTLAAAMSIHDKLENYAAVDKVLEDLVASYEETDVERRADAKAVFKDLKEHVMRDEALERGTRLDGRTFDQIRPITIDVGVLPRTHGSVIFTRGETQALVTATLGTADDKKRSERREGGVGRGSMRHYTSPPFSVGEVGRMTGPGRREIGHGALAERALLGMLPAEETFPYTVRIVSDILESNGSSSMA